MTPEEFEARYGAPPGEFMTPDEFEAKFGADPAAQEAPFDRGGINYTPVPPGYNPTPGGRRPIAGLAFENLAALPGGQQWRPGMQKWSVVPEAGPRAGEVVWEGWYETEDEANAAYQQLIEENRIPGMVVEDGEVRAPRGGPMEFLKDFGGGLLKSGYEIGMLPGTLMQAYDYYVGQPFARTASRLLPFIPDMPDEYQPNPWFAPSFHAIEAGRQDLSSRIPPPENAAGRWAETVGEYTGGGPLALPWLRNLTGSLRQGLKQSLTRFGAVPGAAAATASIPFSDPALQSAIEIPVGLVADIFAGMRYIPSTADLPSSAGRILNQHMRDLSPAQIQRTDALMGTGRYTVAEAVWEASDQTVDLRRIVNEIAETQGGGPVLRKWLNQRAERNADHYRGIMAEVGETGRFSREFSEAMDGYLDNLRGRANQMTKSIYTDEAGQLIDPGAYADFLEEFPEWGRFVDNLRAGGNENLRLLRQKLARSGVLDLPDNSVGFFNEVRRLVRDTPTSVSDSLSRAAQSELRKTVSEASDLVRHRSPMMGIADEAQAAVRRNIEGFEAGAVGRAVRAGSEEQILTQMFNNPQAYDLKEIQRAVSAFAEADPDGAARMVRGQLERVFHDALGANKPSDAMWGDLIRDLVGTEPRQQALRAAVHSLPDGQNVWDGLEIFLDQIGIINRAQTGNVAGRGVGAGALQTATTGPGRAAQDLLRYIATAFHPSSAPFAQRWAAKNMAANGAALAHWMTGQSGAMLLRRIALAEDNLHRLNAIGVAAAHLNTQLQQWNEAVGVTPGLLGPDVVGQQ